MDVTLTSYLIDLYLGGDLGLWALSQAASVNIGHVITFDPEIAQLAQSRGLKVWFGDVHKANFFAGSAGFSIHYPIILKPELISKYRKLYNLHPGYLPWGRGFYPVFWALWEGTPAGATLHEISAGIDEGPIVAQIRVEYSGADTGGSLHQRVRAAEKELFIEYWSRILSGENMTSRSQTGNIGSYHAKKEFFELKNRGHWETLTGAELIKLVRCFTFSGYPGLEIALDDQKFQVWLEPLAHEPQLATSEVLHEIKY